MNEHNKYVSYVTIRIHPKAHAILKALSGFEGVSMAIFMDRLMEEEAQRRGIKLRPVDPVPKLELSGEIAIPVR